MSKRNQDQIQSNKGRSEDSPRKIRTAQEEIKSVTIKNFQKHLFLNADTC